MRNFHLRKSNRFANFRFLLSELRQEVVPAVRNPLKPRVGRSRYATGAQAHDQIQNSASPNSALFISRHRGPRLATPAALISNSRQGASIADTRLNPKIFVVIGKLNQWNQFRRQGGPLLTLQHGHS